MSLHNDSSGHADRTRLITFDVFETLIVRAHSPHEAVFHETGKLGILGGHVRCSAYAFAAARAAAEKKAARLYKAAMTFEHIYAELTAMLTLSEFERQAIASLELEVERSLMRPVPAANALVEDARRKCLRAVFVSDMYLPAEFIQSLLQANDLWRDGDSLYVSHVFQCTKASGRLFHVVADGENVPLQAITHFGNHARVDVAGAERAGAVGKLLDAGNPNRYERALQERRFATDGLGAAFAGASRLSRLKHEGKHSRAVIEVAAGVIAPVLTAYVIWILRQALSLDVKRLYFVSRDGEILVPIARKLAHKLGHDLEIRYLYGSRLVWNRAVSSPSLNPHVWRSLMSFSSKGYSNSVLFERIGLPVAAKRRVLARVAGINDAWAQTEDRAVLLEAIRIADETRELEAARLQNKRCVVDYLRQEGLFDESRKAFVDVGWRGTQHDVLLELQSEEGAPLSSGFFIGLEESTTRWDALRSAFYFDSRPAPVGRSQPSVSSAYQPLFELFCSGSTGTLLNYRYDESGNVHPVFDAEGGRKVREWGLYTVQETVWSFAEALEIDKISAMGSTDITPLADVVLDLFCRHPTRQEAEAWGNFPWEYGQGSQQIVSDFAPPLGKLKRKGFKRGYSTQWLEGSWVRSAPAEQVLFKPKMTARRTTRAITRGLIEAGRKIVMKR